MIEAESQAPPVVLTTEKPVGAGPSFWPLLVILASLLLINLTGLRYYLLPITGRVRDPLHAWLKPSGYVGQSAGILALILFILMWLYPLRKRWSGMVKLGRLPRWLDWHILAGLTLPIIGGMHAGWRFQGLIGIGYLSMLLVSLSGIVGRYLYVRIPKSRQGLELSIVEINSRREAAVDRLVRLTGLQRCDIEALVGGGESTRQTQGLTASILALIHGDLTRHRTSRQLRKRLSGARPDRRSLPATEIREIMHLARHDLGLAQRACLLEATQRVFRFWHTAHLPFAISAFVAVTIHVAVVVFLGVTWLW